MTTLNEQCIADKPLQDLIQWKRDTYKQFSTMMGDGKGAETVIRNASEFRMIYHSTGRQTGNSTRAAKIFDIDKDILVVASAHLINSFIKLIEQQQGIIAKGNIRFIVISTSDFEHALKRAVRGQPVNTVFFDIGTDLLFKGNIASRVRLLTQLMEEALKDVEDKPIYVIT